MIMLLSQIKWQLFIVLYYYFLFTEGHSLLCYNGTFSNTNYGNDPLMFRDFFWLSHRTAARTRCALTILCADWTSCGGSFAPINLAFNGSRLMLTNCSGENAMCFTRSWSSRAHYAWMVQRGCYQTIEEDPILETVTIPTRAMTCKHERLADAEYKVCICQADWCNGSTKVLHQVQCLALNMFFLSTYSVLLQYMLYI
ncbi:uncharacterized protein LOC131841974 [Achroia grisella]|uniref:uncharacterized protein LOC131841974 n=1 Tax=Achroia grisella TaxID=688607 RepID=UPI0027D28DC7|nr:uncharacterized protein LOC131841974 [Achroia grisella]